MTSQQAPDPAERQPLIERRYWVAFALVTSLFLSWALAASLNDILIRQFRKALDLTRTEASLIQFAFYIGYFCAALPAGLLIRRFGYKPTILAGLALYAGGALLFAPAAELRVYAVFLAALYAIAIGLAFLETAANPYIAILGSARTASGRLNLAQAFYGIGAILGGTIGARFIFSGTEYTPDQISALDRVTQASVRAAEAAKVVGPYLAIAAAMTVLALVIALVRFPVLPRAEPSRSTGSPFVVLRDARLRWAVFAQFCYVGGQVGVWSFFIDFTKELRPDIPERSAALLFSLSLALLTLGRFTAAPIQRWFQPQRLLALYAIANVVLCLFASGASGLPAIIALLSTSFFMSIMYPTIFTLGVENLDSETELGASFLVMAIIGGALIPPAMAIVADAIGGVHHAMIIPALCFAVCLAFALRAPRLGARTA